MTSDRVFVGAWLDSDSALECANRLGLAVTSVTARATRLRKAGVHLPKFARKIKEVDVEGLNALING